MPEMEYISTTKPGKCPGTALEASFNPEKAYLSDPGHMKLSEEERDVPEGGSEAGRVRRGREELRKSFCFPQSFHKIIKNEGCPLLTLSGDPEQRGERR
ncbi:hypothetical protein AOLI_G00099430 [Acnodon oligacanthus]